MVDEHVEEILEGVYDITWYEPPEGPEFVRRGRLRTYLFDFDNDVPTLVDTCVKPRADRLIRGIESTGVTPERLVITHKHADHAGAFDEIVERFGTETWVPVQENLQEEEGLDVDTPADNFYEGGETIGRFEAVHIGGHSPGSSVLVDETAGVAECGDALSGSDRRGLPAGYLVHPPQGTNIDQPPEAVIEAEENLDRLVPYDFDVALVHHGSNVFEDASRKLEEYVDFEPNYLSETEDSIHRPDRTAVSMDRFRRAYR